MFFFKCQLTLVLASALLMLSGCAQLNRPEPAPYFAETSPPLKQELRWSNGKKPKSLDPAKAASAPETDIARALYEGLTDLDPRTLDPVPAAAERWESSEDKRTWKFYIRENSVWSNGAPVTAGDFVRSWKRLADMGDKAAHRELLKNIRGLVKPRPKDTRSSPTPEIVAANTEMPLPSPEANSNAAATVTPSNAEGVVAESERVIRIDLVHADKDLPKLISHPIFRPVFEEPKAEQQVAAVTNGPFRLSSLSDESVTLERSESYWDKGSVKLERVSFVAAASPEKALDAYRSGDIDAITNAEFSPAALKLLEPYDDFRRTAFNAINLYDFNVKNAPFNDRRVRQALSYAIQREKLTEGELQGTTRPADTFLPAGSKSERRVSLDVARAQSLLEEAGFPEGKGFPKVRLALNRNDAQQRIAKAIAQMWTQNLGIETEIIVKEPIELESLKLSGEYDLIRRGIVLPTADEIASILAIFGSNGDSIPDSAKTPEPVSPFSRETSLSGPLATETLVSSLVPAPILTEDDALYELRSIPLYFATSVSLVKPYVKGFDANVLEAPSLKSVEIDPNWRTQ